MGSLVFRGANRDLVEAAVKILEAQKPMTLRQLFYRVVSTGQLKNSHREYKRLGRLMTRLREAREIPLSWIVDHIRATLKPSSWSGLADFGDTVCRAYRKDFWANLPSHVEVFVEKDAIAGTIQPLTREYDVALNVCRGYTSLSFVGEIAEQWSRIRKRIFAYYIGDFDPSGFDLERDLVKNLQHYSGKEIWQPNDCDDGDELSLPEMRNMISDSEICWVRLAVLQSDFQAHQLIPLPVKMKDTRAKGFLTKHGQQCAEVDALPPTEIRRRIEEAILSHIPSERWERLQEIEAQEKQSLETYLSAWAAHARN